MEGLIGFGYVLTLVFLLPSTTGVSDFCKYGCTFKNKSYYLQESSLSQPVWGNDIESFQINNVERLKDRILRRIIRIMGNVMESTIVNQVDSYVEFYQKYLALKQEFEMFFQNYVPQYTKHQYSGFAIAVLDKLITEYPDLEEHCYLSTAFVAVPGDQYEEINDDDSREYFRNNHVAGAIKIRIQNEEGIILLEPGLGIDTPIVLTQNGKYLHTEHVNKKTVHEKEEIWHLKMDSKRKYITAKVYDYENPDRVKEVHLYYVAKPFCSVIHTTLKTNLLSKYKIITKRSKSGAQLASIHFKLAYRSKFKVIFLDDYENNKLKIIQWSDLPNLKQDDQIFFDRLCEKLGVNSTDLKVKLQIIHSSLNDRNFMIGKENMYKFLNEDICKTSQRNEPEKQFDYSIPEGYVEFEFDSEKPSTNFLKRILKKFACGRPLDRQGSFR